MTDEVTSEQQQPVVPAEQPQQVSTQEVEVDHSATDLLDPQLDAEPAQVKPVTVIYVPFKDFEARVNSEAMYFRKDVPTKVTRDVAAMLIEDKTRGYVKD